MVTCTYKILPGKCTLLFFFIGWVQLVIPLVKRFQFSLPSQLLVLLLFLWWQEVSQDFHQEVTYVTIRFAFLRFPPSFLVSPTVKAGNNARFTFTSKILNVLFKLTETYNWSICAPPQKFMVIEIYTFNWYMSSIICMCRFGTR